MRCVWMWDRGSHHKWKGNDPLLHQITHTTHTNTHELPVQRYTIPDAKTRRVTSPWQTDRQTSIPFIWTHTSSRDKTKTADVDSTSTNTNYCLWPEQLLGGKGVWLPPAASSCVRSVSWPTLSEALLALRCDLAAAGACLVCGVGAVPRPGNKTKGTEE